MGNLQFLGSDLENPKWNNLPPEHTAKHAKDLDELLHFVRTFGDDLGNSDGNGFLFANSPGEVVDDVDELTPSPRENSNTPKAKVSPKDPKSPYSTTARIYPEGSQSTSQRSRTGKTLVSLR